MHVCMKIQFSMPRATAANNWGSSNFFARLGSNLDPEHITTLYVNVSIMFLEVLKVFCFCSRLSKTNQFLIVGIRSIFLLCW